MGEIVLIDGKSVKAEMPLRSLLYGEGVFETFRWKSRPPIYYEKHIGRMREGASSLGLPFPKCEDLAGEIERSLGDAGIFDAYVKIGLLSLGSPLFHEHPRGSSILLVLRDYEPQKESFSVKLSSYRRNSKSPILRIKSLNYLENILAKREALASGCDEAILLNERDELAEGIVSNIFFIIGKVVYTPSLRCGLLEGITRDIICQTVGEVGFELREGIYTLEHLKHSDGVFMTNSLIGAKPVCSIDSVSIPSGGEVFSKVEQEVHAKLGWG